MEWGIKNKNVDIPSCDFLHLRLEMSKCKRPAALAKMAGKQKPGFSGIHLSCQTTASKKKSNRL
jgi:hypothetical protein